MPNFSDRLLPGRRAAHESGRDYLMRLAAGPARGGPLVSRELARQVLELTDRVEALERRLYAPPG